MTANWVRSIAEDVLGGAPVEVGKRYLHPADGAVEVVSGQYWGAQGLSNHWRWRVVATGEIRSGYADYWPVIR